MYAKALDHQVISHNADYIFHLESLQKCQLFYPYCWTIYAVHGLTEAQEFVSWVRSPRILLRGKEKKFSQ